MPGRNDPCPCGSGRKFKLCCAGPRAPRAAYTREERESALERLVEFGAQARFAGHHEVVGMLFWPNPESRERAYSVLDEAGREQESFRFLWWSHCDADYEPGRSLADLLLETKGWQIGSGERAFLARVAASRLALYEVTRVQPGEGLGLRDLVGGEETWVRERSASRQLVPWDLLAARVFEGTGGHPVVEGDSYLFRRADKAAILDALKREHRKTPGQPLPEFLKRCGHLFHWIWLDLVLFRPPPTLVNEDGDAVELGRSVYDIRDLAALEEGVDGHPAFERADGGSWSCREVAEGEGRILGTLTREGEALVVEAFSRRRVARVRRLLAEAAGDSVRYRWTRYEDPWDRVAREPPPAEQEAGLEDALPPEVKERVEREFKDQHYRSWADLPVPAFGGRSPREAVRTPRGREEVVDLLKDFENAEARGPRPYDFTWLWEELGLDHPGV